MPDRLTYGEKLDLAANTGAAHDRTGDVVQDTIAASRANWLENRGHVELTSAEAQYEASQISSAVRHERSLTAQFTAAMHDSTLGGRIGLDAAYHTAAGHDVINAATEGAVIGGTATAIAGAGAAVGALAGAGMMGASASAENAASERFLRELEERGVDVGNQASLSAALQNRTIMNEVMTEVNASQGVSTGIGVIASAIPGSIALNNTVANAADGGAQAALDGRSATEIVSATVGGAGQGIASSVVPGGRGHLGGALIDVSLRL